MNYARLRFWRRRAVALLLLGGAIAVVVALATAGATPNRLTRHSPTSVSAGTPHPVRPVALRHSCGSADCAAPARPRLRRASLGGRGSSSSTIAVAPLSLAGGASGGNLPPPEGPLVRGGRRTASANPASG